MTNYRLGLSIGSNFIGWCALNIEENGMPTGILDLDTRVFHNGRNINIKNPEALGESLASERTQIRGVRRNKERSVRRKRNVLKQLRKFGLLAENKSFDNTEIRSLNKLKIRHDAVTQKITLEEISIAFYQLQKNRGFKSNRKDAQKEEGKELKGMKLGISNLVTSLKGRTVGQFLYERNFNDNISRKFRGVINDKGKLLYNFYPSRELIEHEFNTIWTMQQKYYPELFTEEAKKEIYKAIFYQRPLKPKIKGKCTLIPNDNRMEWAIPSAQRFRIIKEVNNLDFVAPESMRNVKLNQAQRRKLYDGLCLNSSLTFRQIKKLLGLSSEYEFNLDTNEREKLEGDRTAKLMREEMRFGNKWDELSLDEQDNIINILQNDDEGHEQYMDDETLQHWLISNCKVTPAQAKMIMNTALPKGCSNFGTIVITSILPKMLDEGMLEHQAIAACGWKYTESYTGEIYDILPYYGEILTKHVVEDKDSTDTMVHEFGRLSNPSVHIAFNQCRHIMNALKARYGEWPKEIVIQIDRNLKKGIKEVTQIIKEISIDKKKKEKWRNEIEKYKASKATSEDFLKMKLWEELAKDDPTQRKCIYTGKMINISMLFSEAETQLDYILPFSRTLDETNANRIIVTTYGASIKRNQTPYEAFCGQSAEYSYEAVKERSKCLSKSKQWRFEKDAMDIFCRKAREIELKSSLNTNEVIDTGIDPFAVRPLNDTSYIAKISRKYLSHACQKGERGIISTPGTLNRLLRGAWGLNDILSRHIIDHRQSAIDAFTLCLTTYFTVKKIQYAALISETTGVKITRVLSRELPYAKFSWEEVKEKIINAKVSYRPDHNANGKLHEDTYYGYIKQNENKKSVHVVTRAPIHSLIKKKEKDGQVKYISYIENIRDEGWKKKIKEFIGTREDLDSALQEFIQLDKGNLRKEVHSLRMVYEMSTSSLVTLKKDSQGNILKLASGGSNHRVEIYCPMTGKNGDKWQMEVIKTFDANQRDFVPNWRKEYPDAKQIMILHPGDLVAYEEEGITEIRRVKKISVDKTIHLTSSHIAKEKSHEFTWGASAKQLQLKNARHIIVKIDGSVYDPLNIIKN